jgi:hypothetical protein
MTTEKIVVGEISAWRVWRVRKSRDLLTSVYMSEKYWYPGGIMTGCPSFTSEGVYAWKTKKEMFRYMGSTTGQIVVGKVDLWGQIVEHRRGYRAQYAKITEICAVFPRDDTYLKKLAKLYDVKVEKPFLDEDYRECKVEQSREIAVIAAVSMLIVLLITAIVILIIQFLGKLLYLI